MDLPKWAPDTSGTRGACGPSPACRSPSHKAPRSSLGLGLPQRPGAGGARARAGPASCCGRGRGPVAARADSASCPGSVNLGGLRVSTNTALGLFKLNFFPLRKSHPQLPGTPEAVPGQPWWRVSWGVGSTVRATGLLGPAQLGGALGSGSRRAGPGARGFGARGEPVRWGADVSVNHRTVRNDRKRRLAPQAPPCLWSDPSGNRPAQPPQAAAW